MRSRETFAFRCELSDIIHREMIFPVSVSESIFQLILTLWIDALEFVKVLSMDFEVNTLPTVRTKPSRTLFGIIWEPLMVTYLALEFLDFYLCLDRINGSI
jgi:hypothetical protein